MSPEHKELSQHIQRNCHISDARHAGDYTLCVYLLKMREFFRWEQSHDFNTTLSTDDIGQWLTDRESLWDELENEDYAPVNTKGTSHDPFDANSINPHLLEHGLVYSGGIGFKSKPHFFLGELNRIEKHDDYTIYVSDKEYARDLTSPPAMSQGKSIFIRRESFKRYIWEKTEEWRWNKPENAMAHAIRCYDFDNQLEASLDKMTDNELESAILHEIGEIKAGEQLSGWSDMMHDLMLTPAEIMARAVRDHLADAITTLPSLIAENNEASIHFYFANLTNMRKKIFPSLVDAYQQWLQHKDNSQLKNAVNSSHDHWLKIATHMLILHANNKSNCSSEIASLVENHIL